MSRVDGGGAGDREVGPGAGREDQSRIADELGEVGGGDARGALAGVTVMIARLRSAMSVAGAALVTSGSFANPGVRCFGIVIAMDDDDDDDDGS